MVVILSSLGVIVIKQSWACGARSKVAPDAGCALRFEVLKQHLQSTIKILPMPEPALALYSAFSRPAADTYLARYEQALREVQAEISYEQFFTTRLAP